MGEVMQVADELVSNAFEHGGGPQVIRLCDRVPGRTTIEVEDSNHETLTMGRSRFGDAAHRGRGLVLVHELAATWGVRRKHSSVGKIVWAEVAGG